MADPSVTATRSFASNLVIAFAASVVLSSGAIADQIPADHRSKQVDSLFAFLDDGKRPGAAVMVVNHGKIVYSRGFGYADLENDVRITPESAFRLASVSKQFTAMAIVVLEEQGKLGFDDLLAKFLPEQAVYPGITIRHLMTHTSGLPDYLDVIEESDRLLTNSIISQFIADIGKAEFMPGEKYEYSNSAYELLSLVIEAVSGQRFAQFMQENVFAPAGMTGSLIFDDTEPEMSQRVYGYDSTTTGYTLNDAHFLNGIVGSGGTYATLNDFYSWDQALYGENVVSSESLDASFTRAILNNGVEIDYGFGWRLDDYRGYPRIAHGGSWVGFRTSIARFVSEELAIVVLGNFSDFKPRMYVDRVADIYLPEKPGEFRTAATPELVGRQMRRLPTDKIWWDVYGTDQAWNFRNLHRIFPTVNVYRNGPVTELGSTPVPEIGAYEIETPLGKMSFDRFIKSDQSTLTGIVVLHKGQIAYERYPRMHEHEMPVYWSVAKTFVGTVIRILEERGEINVSRQMAYYIPEISESDFADITVRDVLDMATGLDCSDDYSNQKTCYYRYSATIGDGFRVADSQDNPYEFLAKLKGTNRHAEPGHQFSYSGLNTFALAWLVEKVTGVPFPDVFSREIWTRIGAESNASYIAPRYGIAVTHGGFMALMRDVARFGLLFTPSYRTVTEEQIISDEHLDFIMNGGRSELLTNAGRPNTSASGIKHNIYQWDRVYVNGDIYKSGWAGQGLLINPRRDTVVVFTGYMKDVDGTEVKALPKIMEVMNGVFGE